MEVEIKSHHLEIIAKFISVVLIYIIGMLVIFFGAFMGLGSLAHFVWEKLNWNVILGTPISITTKQITYDFMWAFNKIIILAINVFIIWLGMIHFKEFLTRRIREAKENAKLHSVIYGITGAFFGLIAAAITIICYLFILGFEGFFATSGMSKFGFIIYILMPLIFSFFTVAIFVIFGIRAGKSIP